MDEAECDKLKNILKELRNYENDNALNHFKDHLSNIKSKSNICWKRYWLDTAYNIGYELGRQCAKDALESIIDIRDKNDSPNEVCEFYQSLVKLNDQNSNKNELENELIIQCDKFRNNPVFPFMLGKIYFMKNTTEVVKQAEKQFRKALSCLEQEPQAEQANENNNAQGLELEKIIYIDEIFKCYEYYFQDLIDKKEYNKGVEMCNTLQEKGILCGSWAGFHSLRSKLQSYKEFFFMLFTTQKAMLELDRNNTEKIKKSQFKIIEILGFFTAIIAFIFSTVSIGKNFDFKEAMLFNVSLGLTLVIFALVMNIIFSGQDNREDTSKDKDTPTPNQIKIFILLLLLGVLALFIGWVRCNF